MDPKKYEEWKRHEAWKRFQERRKLKEVLKKYKPKKRTSVDTVSGGLPSLGKRR